MSAERAQELRLVNWLVPEKDLQKKIDDVTAKVTAQSAPVLTMAKKAIMGSLGIAAAGWGAQLDECFLERTGGARGFAGRFACAGRKARAAVEEPLKRA